MFIVSENGYYMHWDDGAITTVSCMSDILCDSRVERLRADSHFNYIDVGPMEYFKHSDTVINGSYTTDLDFPLTLPRNFRTACVFAKYSNSTLEHHVGHLRVIGAVRSTECDY